MRSSSPSVERPITGLKVLVVDDLPMCRRLLQSTLQAEGCVVREAADGMDALAAMEEEVPDVIISDILMPRMDGFTLCRKIRNDARFKSVPYVIYTSSYDSPADEKNAYVAGADRYLVKPAAVDVLVDALRTVTALEHDPRSRLDDFAEGPAVMAEYNAALVRKLEEKNNELTARLQFLAQNEHESEARYRFLFTHHPLPMWVYDVQSLQFLAVNDAALQQYGYTRDQFLGMTLKDIRPEEDVPDLLDSLRTSSDPNRVWRHRRRDGTLIHVEVSARTMDFANHKGRLVTIVDVTARHHAEQALRAAEAKYRRIFEDSIEGLYQTTPDGHFISANPALAQMLGYASPEELIAQRTDIGRQGYVQPARREEFKRLIAERGVVRNFEYEVRRKGGGTIVVSENARVVRSAGGEVMYYEGSMIDITDRTRLTTELLRAQRMESVGRLASGIAHDMNNILSPIMMAAPLLRMPLRPADVEKTLNTIEASARRGADLVRQLLAFGRGVEGGRGPVDTSKLVHEVTRMAAETFPKNITVVTEASARVWPMCGDVSQLHQVLLNLCVNARDAMPQGGTLTVTASNVEFSDATVPPHPDAKPGQYVALTVADTGTGIPPEIADRVFDPFFTTKEEGKGTGLGLSMVVGLVKGHGGFLNLRTAINEGTTFEIFVPAVPGAVENRPVPAVATRQGNGELILIVDDEASIRDVLTAALSRHNYRILVATNGTEAAAIFAHHISDVKLVVTDIDMPSMDGIKLIRRLRELNPALKVLVSSGLGMGRGFGDRSSELQRLGIEAVLAKPYTIEEVIRAVHAELAG